MRTSDRIFGYDLIKCLTIIGIVFYHFQSIEFSSFPTDGSTYYPGIGKFLYALLCAGVPMFFMVNGAIVGNKNLSIQKCWVSAFHMLLTGVFWTLIFKCIVYPVFWNEKIVFDLKEFWFQYWFFYTLAFVYLLTWVLNRITWLRLLVVVLLLLFPFFSNFFWIIVRIVSPDVSVPTWSNSGALTLYTIVYYYLGRFLADKHFSFFFTALSVLFGLFFVNFCVFVESNAVGKVADSVSAYLPSIGAIFINCGFFMLFKDVVPSSPNWIVRFVSFLGQRTLSVYLFHAVFIKLVVSYIFNYQCQPPVVVFFFAVLVSFLCAVIWHYSSFVFKKNNYEL